MKGYSTREVAELLRMPVSVVRRYARSGLLGDTKEGGYRHHYTFQDIVILRTAKELHDSGIKPSKISRALHQLKNDLPSRKSLTALRISGLGGEVVVQENQELYRPGSGQILFNFSVAELASNVAPLARKAAAEAEFDDEQLTSDDWFDLAIDLEAVSPEDAPAAYLRALELDPEHADAHINLGRILHEEGDWNQAEQHYRQAIVAEPDHPLAHYNLGTLMEDMGRIDAAITAYREATMLPDAHYNLARLLELKGELREARHHLEIYKELMSPSPV